MTWRERIGNAVAAALLATLLFWALPAVVGAQDAIETVEQTGVDSWEDLAAAAPPEMWEYGAMLVLPAIVQYVKTKRWNDEDIRFLVIGLAVVVALGGAYLRGELTNVAFTGASVVKIAVGAGLVYDRVYKAKPFAGLSALLGSMRDGPSKRSQRAGYKGAKPDSPPPGG